MYSYNERIVEGDTVRVTIQGSILSKQAKVLGIPCATGDSWRFQDMSNGALYYVSEGCTVTRWVEDANLVNV